MRQLITKQEAAKRLGISTVTLWRLAKRENFGQFPIGGRLQFDKNELEDFVESKRIGGVKRADKVSSDGEVTPLVFGEIKKAAR